jgi:nucleoid DNA-binding protein
MQGIQKIIQEVNQKSKINSKETTQKVINAFLETIKQKLSQGESINFKNYFTLKRMTTKPKGSKHCNRHEKAINDYKQTNKGKGLAAFAGSVKFRGLIQETRKCKDCQRKKQELIKSAKLTNRVSFKVSPGLLKTSGKSSKATKRR